MNILRYFNLYLILAIVTQFIIVFNLLLGKFEISLFLIIISCYSFSIGMIIAYHKIRDDYGDR